MLVRRRCVMVLGGGVLCMLCFASLLMQQDQQDEPEVRGKHQAPLPPSPAGQDQVQNALGEGEGEGGGGEGEKQQVRRHLLDTVGTPMHVTNPHISYIRLEGVDSSGNDLFMVHGATVEQLKGVCSALEECEGFNSEGWIKSRVAGKKRSTIDLYLKQVASGVVEEWGELPLDEGAGLFLNLMQEYDKMEEELQIFVYETSVGQDMPSLEDYKYGVEQLFISLLAKSKYRTTDPAKATLFFLPSRCTAYRKSVPQLERGIQKAAAVTRDMVNDIRSRFPYWNESLGADHFYICAHDMGTEVTRLADSALWKNAVGLVNTADYSEPYFVPHKDISVPPHPGRGTIQWALIGQGGATFDPYQRTKLAFLAGNEERGVRPQIYKHYGSDPEFHLVRGHMTEQDYMKALKTSKFCLCPRGNKGWSPRVMDAVWFGCIPVFIADHYVPPLYDIIPWSTFSVAVPESQVSSLKAILQDISYQKIAVMQQNILKVYHHLTWHDPPQPYDAFHAVLFQLWRQRHSPDCKTKPLFTLGSKRVEVVSMFHSPSSPVEAVSTMQGTLWKWTNYLSGWQPRWFVLDGGSLSYFLSPNEVHLGSRGSLKISSCDILVHSSDHQRVDMVMPGGRHIYLRAASMSERQQWLLAFGVAKQGPLESTDSESVGGGKNVASSSLQHKVNHLHSNCELLVSQIASIKAMVAQPSNIDPEALSGLSSDVAVTCDNFLNALHECMDLSLASQQLSSALKPLPLKELYAPKKGGGLSPVSKLSGFSESDLYPPPPPPTPASAALPQLQPAHRATPTTPTVKKTLPAHLMKPVIVNDTSHEASTQGALPHGPSAQDDDRGGANTEGKTPTDGKSPTLSPDPNGSKHHSRNQSTHSASDYFITPTSSPPPSPALSGGRRPMRIGARVAAGEADKGRRHETFFSSLPAKFQDLELLQEAEQGAGQGEELVPSEQFLECCEAVLPFFDMLSATAFAPIKADINGNIKKLRKKYSEDCDAYPSLQAMVNSELEAGTCEAKNSATDALLWLKRAMEFVQHFIAEVSAGEHSLDVAAGKAYGLSLRRYHGWIVRGVFNLAMKAVPYHRDFLRVLGSLGTDEGERQVTADMAVFAASLGEIVLILNVFYQKHNLDPLPTQ